MTAEPFAGMRVLVRVPSHQVWRCLDLFLTTYREKEVGGGLGLSLRGIPRREPCAPDPQLREFLGLEGGGPGAF